MVASSHPWSNSLWGIGSGAMVGWALGLAARRLWGVAGRGCCHPPLRPLWMGIHLSTVQKWCNSLGVQQGSPRGMTKRRSLSRPHQNPSIKQTSSQMPRWQVFKNTSTYSSIALPFWKIKTVPPFKSSLFPLHVSLNGSDLHFLIFPSSISVRSSVTHGYRKHDEDETSCRFNAVAVLENFPA